MKRGLVLAVAILLSSIAYAAGSAPVNFGVSQPKGEEIRVPMTFKINADKEISQVDIAVKELDAAGKTLEQTTYIWQNIVHSAVQPIKKGETYTDKYRHQPETKKIDVQLTRVVFKDGTDWKPGK